ncbi:S26 family signal peptidase [Mesorhizobium sp. M4B.F.Ca.ET.169.01.1.1]|uniref:S26 family signal peptidase n=1 Tax=unclassified Mesorhizobium TaxID=325217 RepID=UPI000FC9EDAA|nr:MULTISPECIES: S26 family signal peptidase [unclassified Mesorhizobium]RVD43462.1 S26 family signal peptidase [Mesorhizobium sp. M4B.F.Ca.ET.019.03.1.1]TGT41931.1 S26 family signal peptidase [Mesorhizobium sp. M4B.F.Ca.ET.169.01.1.1]
MSMRATIAAAMLGGAVLVAAPTWLRHRPQFIWNASASVPIGLYRVEPADSVGVVDIAVVKPPEALAHLLAARGYLPHGVPLLKRVLALGGQTVCRRGSAIIVRGVTFGHARQRDTRGRLLPVWQGCRVIAGDEVFLMNWDAADSFDGRYFGPLPRASIIGRAVPLWGADHTSQSPNVRKDSVPEEP